jgi:large subunit ribosomal protein L4
MARKALFMAISSKVKDKQLFVLDNIKLENPKTKEMALILKNFSRLMGNKPTTLLALPLMDEKVNRSSKNLPGFTTIEARNLNPLEVFSHKYLILIKDSVDALTKTFNK